MARRPPSKLYVLWDQDGFVLAGETREELEDYMTGEDDEHLYEYQFTQEHPINVDLQEDPEDGSEKGN